MKSWFFDKKGNVKEIEVEVKKTETGAIPDSTGFAKMNESKSKVVNKKAA